MHDPMSVQFEIRRPWPTRSSPPPESRSWIPRPSGGWTPPDNTANADWKQWGRFEWIRHQLGCCFWEWNGKRWYFPSLVTIWHVDPEADGSDNSCGWPRNRWRKFHVHHWRVQFQPWGKLRRWLWTRCEQCEKRFPYGYAPLSGSWGSKRPRMFQGERGLFHHDECLSRYRAYQLQKSRAIVNHADRKSA